VKLESLDYDLKSVTTQDGRLYETPTGQRYPSVTTVLSAYNKKAIFEWRQRVGEEQANRISRKASGRGTKLHTICENYLMNEIDEVKFRTMIPDTKQLFLQLKPHLDDNIGRIYGIEQSLYSDRLKIAGRCDCIAEWNGELSIVDYKTSSWQKDEDKILNYFMQCTAYAEMFEERTGMPVNQIVVAVAVEETQQAQIFVREKDKYIQSLMQFIAV
jgi:ATP-dependent exoDNAse (exonuclease V) beta subunit